jgi:hypothetical protein
MTFGMVLALWGHWVNKMGTSLEFLSFYLESGFIVVFCCEHLGQNKQKF